MAGGVATLLAVTFGCMPAWAQDAPAGDALAGRRMARTVCAPCHGTNGIAKLPEAANLAGQDAGYIQRQLAAFKSGERKNEIMSQIAGTLEDKQMADVAAYFAAIKVEVKEVPGGG